MALQKLICCAVTCIFCLLLAVGCSQRDTNRSSITGEVKLDGKPLERDPFYSRPSTARKVALPAVQSKTGDTNFPATKAPQWAKIASRFEPSARPAK